LLNQARQLASAADPLAVEFDDDVAALQARLVRRPVRVHFLNLHAGRRVSDPHAQLAAPARQDGQLPTARACSLAHPHLSRSGRRQRRDASHGDDERAELHQLHGCLFLPADQTKSRREKLARIASMAKQPPSRGSSNDTTENRETKAQILELAEREKVKFMRLQFTDILGTIKNVEIPDRQFEEALDGKIMFDGSSIEGFVRIEESDMYLRPDLATFRI